ncbi:putative phage abortive infection protein [Chitinimonas arctica]|uniref:putative phage abortive infection protein n=1 Tax=Chitinimonas arctica TaxID=2594795 RepID=UPI0015D0E177|nr:putative phage abortive infection protein [Chitinimonas arctica]
MAIEFIDTSDAWSIKEKKFHADVVKSQLLPDEFPILIMFAAANDRFEILKSLIEKYAFF